MLGSNRYDITRLGNLISEHINYNSDSAGIELSNMIIDGEDFIDAIENIRSEIEDYEVMFNKERYKKKEMINELEKILGTKTGSFPDKIRHILKKYSTED
jgi:hypothetical protein